MSTTALETVLKSLIEKDREIAALTARIAELEAQLEANDLQELANATEEEWLREGGQ